MNRMAQQGLMANLNIILISIMRHNKYIVGIGDWISNFLICLNSSKKAALSIIVYLIPPKGFVEFHGGNLSEM